MTGRITPSGPRVAILAYDGLCAFEFGIAQEVFALPRPEMGARWYRCAIHAAEPGPIRMAGIAMQLPRAPALSGADLIVVPGWRGIDAPVPAALCRALRRAHGRGARIMSLCSGIVVLAEARLLEGRAATTHWRYIDAVARRFPSLTLLPDRLYVDAGDVLTAAGSAAGIDLCLHIVRRDFGAAAANSVARRLVVPPHREGGQAQFIRHPVARERGVPLAPLLDWLRARLAQPPRLAEMAAHAGMSVRSFQRHFHATTGRTPGEWLAAARIRAAQDMLEAGRATLPDIAAACGFAHEDALRRAFREHVGVPPSAWRRSFAQNRKSPPISPVTS